MTPTPGQTVFLKCVVAYADEHRAGLHILDRDGTGHLTDSRVPMPVEVDPAWLRLPRGEPDYSIELAWPPSMNHYWRTITVAGRARTIISKEGRAYRKLVGRAVALEGLKGKCTGRLRLRILAYPPDKRGRDLDNILKPLLDALQHHPKEKHVGMYPNDGAIDDLHVVRKHVAPPGRVVVEIDELEEMLY